MGLFLEDGLRSYLKLVGLSWPGGGGEFWKTN